MNADVLVIGAGPTGLMLAGDLAEAGVAVTVLERRTDESNVTRAFAVHARTMEQLRIRGLADTLARTGRPIPSLNLFDRARIDLTRLPSEYRSLLITPQYQTERVLRERAEKLGADIRHGAELIALHQETSHVDVEFRRPDGGRESCRARYVVGADGVNSTVRKALGLRFPGRSVVRSIMLADVRLDDPPSDVVTVDAVADAFAFVAPFGDGWYRVFAWNRRNQVDDREPLELDEVRAVTRKALGTDFGMRDPRWLSRFHSDERQVRRYRVGRVFLAGDAAHCHSPAGGQGMNTGIQDAVNLGWKLAATLQGWGGEQLLDSYHAERHPVGRAVLRSSGAILRLALVRPWLGRQVRNILGRLLLGAAPIADRVAGTISGIGVRYPAPTGHDRRVGTRVPNVRLADGRDLYDVLHGGRFALVGQAVDEIELPQQVDAATAAVPAARWAVVRPDAYLAWVGAPADFPAWAAHYFRRL